MTTMILCSTRWSSISVPRTTPTRRSTGSSPPSTNCSAKQKGWVKFLVFQHICASRSGTGGSGFFRRRKNSALFTEIGRVEPDFERLCVFLVDTGARVGEALGLKWPDIQDGNATFWITKSGRSRTVPLTRRAMQAVTGPSRRDHCGPFSMIDYQNLRYHWNRARKAVGLAGDAQVVPHILRHTCASRLVQAGIDLRRVQSFLGHQTIQMTLRYAHLATDDLAQCAAALDLRNQAADEPGSPTAEPASSHGRRRHRGGIAVGIELGQRRAS